MRSPRYARISEKGWFHGSTAQWFHFSIRRRRSCARCPGNMASTCPCEMSLPMFKRAQVATGPSMMLVSSVRMSFPCSTLPVAGCTLYRVSRACLVGDPSGNRCGDSNCA